MGMAACFIVIVAVPHGAGHDRAVGHDVRGGGILSGGGDDGKAKLTLLDRVGSKSRDRKPQSEEGAGETADAHGRESIPAESRQQADLEVCNLVLMGLGPGHLVKDLRALDALHFEAAAGDEAEALAFTGVDHGLGHPGIPL
jgi:hypothetical protein